MIAPGCAMSNQALRFMPPLKVTATSGAVGYMNLTCGSFRLGPMPDRPSPESPAHQRVSSKSIVACADGGLLPRGSLGHDDSSMTHA